MQWSVRLDEHDYQIAHLEVTRQWSWGEVDVAVTRLKTLVDYRDDYVDVIMHFPTRSFKLPENFTTNVKRINSNPLPNMGMVVFLGNEFIWTLFNAYVANYGGIYYSHAHADTLEQAYEIINAHRRQRPPYRPTRPPAQGAV